MRLQCITPGCRADLHGDYLSSVGQVPCAAPRKNLSVTANEDTITTYQNKLRIEPSFTHYSLLISSHIFVYFLNGSIFYGSGSNPRPPLHLIDPLRPAASLLSLVSIMVDPLRAATSLLSQVNIMIYWTSAKVNLPATSALSSLILHLLCEPEVKGCNQQKTLSRKMSALSVTRIWGSLVSLTFTSDSRKGQEGWWGGSVGKGVCHHAWYPEGYPWDPNGRRKEKKNSWNLSTDFHTYPRYPTLLLAKK